MRDDYPKKLPSRSALLWTAGLMVVASLLTFGTAVSYGFLEFDDSYLIVNNLAIRGPTPEHIWTAFTTYDPELYIPVTLLSYQLNYLFAGLHAGFYHFTNIVLHGLNGFLVTALFYLILRRKAVAVFFGLLFVLHPLNTEAVVWASGRKDLLSTLFLLGTIITYLRHTETKFQRTFYISLVLYILAALSKSSVIVLPVLLPVLLALKNGKFRGLKSSVREMWPFGIVAVIAGLIALFGKTRAIGTLGLAQTVLLSIKSTVFYLQKILVPLHLSAIYPQGKIAISSPDIFVPLIALILICSVCVIVYKKTSWPALTVALFILTIAPSFLNAHKGTQTYFAVDRYAYAGMIWILLLTAGFYCAVADRIPKKLVASLAIFTLGICGYLSSQQTKYWQSDTAVLEHALSLYPESVSARTGLSSAYRQSGKTIQERAVLEEGLQYSEDTALLLGIGSLYAREENFAEAEKQYRTAMARDTTNPEPHFYLGSLYEQQEKIAEAEAEYKKAIAMDSSYIAAIINLGAIALDAGRYEESEKLYKEALSWNKNVFEAQYNLFMAQEYLKKNDEAFGHLALAYELNPITPEIGLSYAYRLHERGDTQKSINVLEHILDIDPNNRAAQRLLTEVKK